MFRNPIHGVSLDEIQRVVIITDGAVGFSLGPMPHGFTTRRELDDPSSDLPYAQSWLRISVGIPLACLKDTDGCVTSAPLEVDRIAASSDAESNNRSFETALWYTRSAASL